MREAQLLAMAAVIFAVAAAWLLKQRAKKRAVLARVA